MTASWGWLTPRTEGIWKHGALWFKPFLASVPWITVILLFVLLAFVSRTLTLAEGVSIDLPVAGAAEAEPAALVALVMPREGDTLVFFDDARYAVADDALRETFRMRLSERVATAENRTLLLLCDRRVSSGDLARLAALARASGVTRILLANRHAEKASE